MVWGYFGSGKHLKSGLFYGGNLKNGALVFILGDAPFFIVLVAEVPFFQESWAMGISQNRNRLVAGVHHWRSLLKDVNTCAGF